MTLELTVMLLKKLNEGVVMCRNVEEYISIVLSQIDCSETKKIVCQVLRSDINKIIRKQHVLNKSNEQLVNVLFLRMGDPKILGQYFLCLKNLVDLH
ncbi:hypothetical protein [Desulfofalx alkaliphila]|uniref:hypothetical protein n=1 Tax=Desulfofalx alkaliphila TaxID=105483 RepID=UPI00146FAC37|nr:hypothetical protein [Desulfofalx alkaliphila]